MQDFLTIAAGLPLALLLGLGVPAIVWLLYFRMGFGLVLVLSACFLDIVLLGYPGLRVGVNVYPQHAVYALVAVAVGLRLASSTEVPTRSGLWLLFGAVLLVSLAIGIPQYGMTAVKDAMSYFYYWIGALYFMSFPMDERRTKQLMSYWLVFGGLLLGLVCFRWVATFSGMSIASTWREIGSGPAAQFRVVGSSAALYLAQALLISIYVVTTQRAKRWIWASIPALLCTVIALQHRSVWVTTAVGIVALYAVFPGQLRLKLMRPMIATGVLVLGLTAGLIGYGKINSLTDHLAESASSGAELDSGTFGGRVYGWQQLLESMEPQHYLIGRPFGTSYPRYDSPRAAKKIDYNAHNFYVEILLRTGMIGLVLLLAAHFSTMWQLLTDCDISGRFPLPPRLVLVLIVMQLVFFIPYGAPVEQSLWIGVALGMAASLRKASAAMSQRAYTPAHITSYGPDAIRRGWRFLHR